MNLRVLGRIARRNARRHLANSVLVIVMVGTPVLAMSGIDVLARTAQLPRAEQARRFMGQADLRLGHGSDVTLPTEVGGHTSRVIVGPTDRVASNGPPTLPPGSHVTAYRTGRVRVHSPAGQRVVDTAELDVRDPITAGLVRVQHGSAPSADDEAMVSPALAHALGIGIGGTLEVADPPARLRVTAIAIAPDDHRGKTLFVRPGANLVERASDRSFFDTTDSWLVALPDGTSVPDVEPAAESAGLTLVARSRILHPPPLSASEAESRRQVLGILLVVAGLGALEVCLLAGTAFAVSARRQRRELALLAAVGSDRRQLRATVLASGVVLGLAGGAAGSVLGVTLAAVLRPVAERYSRGLFGPLDIRPLEVLLIAAIGLVTGVVAAVLPARAASRQDVVAGLTGRRGQSRTPHRVWVIGLGVAAVGAALAFYGSGSGQHRVLGPNGRALTGRATQHNLVLIGAVLAELGFVACAPAVVGLVGRLARRLPLPLRFAVRDAARHRGRSGPAVAAVTAALAGIVAVSVYATSDDAKMRADYLPRHGTGQAYLFTPELSEAATARAVAAVAHELPVRAVVPDVHADNFVKGGCEGDCPPDITLEPPLPRRCPLEVLSSSGRPAQLAVGKQLPPGVANCRHDNLRQSQLAIGDAATLRAYLGRADPAAERALAGGAIVVLDPWFVDGSSVTIRTAYFGPDRPAGTVQATRVSVPAVVVAAALTEARPAGIVSAQAASRLHLPAFRLGTIFDTTRAPTDAEEQAARAALATVSGAGFLDVERGYRSDLSTILLVLLIGSAVITVIATGTATGLAAADSRPDLATLGAVGASPRMRRVIAMAQATTVAAIGSGLGVLAGLVPAVAIVSARNGYSIVMPWGTLGLALVVVPLLAAVPAGLLTRSRLPLVRRLD